MHRFYNNIVFSFMSRFIVLFGIMLLCVLPVKAGQLDYLSDEARHYYKTLEKRIKNVGNRKNKKTIIVNTKKKLNKNSTKEMKKAVEALYFDHPYYWNGLKARAFTLKNKKQKLNVSIPMEYYEKNSLSIAKDYIKNMDLEGKSDFEKIKIIHDLLVNETAYDEKFNKISYTATGVFKNGLGVCDGYSKAFKFLCDCYNIPCVRITGNAKNSVSDSLGGHAWNYVLLNNKWYAIDVTWDDPVFYFNGSKVDTYKNSKNLTYENFLVGSNSTNYNGMRFADTHKADFKLIFVNYKIPNLSETGFLDDNPEYSGYIPSVQYPNMQEMYY